MTPEAGPPGPDEHDRSLLRLAYADLTGPVAPSPDPVTAVLGRMRRRARRRAAARTALVACVVAVVAFASFQVVRLSGPATTVPPSAGGAVAAPRGALPGAGTTSCTFGYRRSTLADRAWAADATVTHIGRGRGDVGVSFHVNTWYRGGSGTDLDLLMPSPAALERVEDAPPAYEVGTRLLLSGEFSGARVLWSCGFTRYYDPSTAAVWQDVFR